MEMSYIYNGYKLCENILKINGGGNVNLSVLNDNNTKRSIFTILFLNNEEGENWLKLLAKLISKISETATDVIKSNTYFSCYTFSRWCCSGACCYRVCISINEKLYGIINIPYNKSESKNIISENNLSTS